MSLKATSITQYLAEIEPAKLEEFNELRNTFLTHLPKGFVESMSYGMITYAVPHSLYAKGYHCKPSEPLPLVSIAVQKHGFSIYHMGIYANPEIYNWFCDAYTKLNIGKLDIGKSCIKIKKTETTPYALIAELCGRFSVEDWITLYEKLYVKNK